MNCANTPLPWLIDPWRRLQAARSADRLPHAALFVGMPGVGKRHLASLLARSLLCSAVDDAGHPCGRCADCRLLERDTHPDLILVGPDPSAKSDDIPVAAVRALAERESLTPGRAAWKVAIIDPADRLNATAANALLKTLEEPAGQTLFCLIAEQSGRLPATVRSRCQQILVTPPPESIALQWLGGEQLDPKSARLRLRLAHGAPLRARDGFDPETLKRRRQRLDGLLAVAAGRIDPVQEAAAWNELGLALFLDCMAGWLSDLARFAVSASPPQIDNLDYSEALANLARGIDVAGTHRMLQRVMRARALLGATVNPLLSIETLMIDWAALNGR